MAAPRLEDVEVVYATPAVQRVVRVAFVPGLTAEEAARRSGLIETLSAAERSALVLGVFGVRVQGEQRLAPGDRVEICRPLVRDPRDRRRLAAKD
jgi:putative ubiquitin-RnfH superfamily antitoxin RatB of RatAB toxin-antitoxin module